jgi:hypothetical protein
MALTEIQLLTQRVSRLEDALIQQGLYKKKHQAGEDITSAVWRDTNKGFDVAFEFQCESCGDDHAVTVFISQGSKDGNIYRFKGLCGATSALRIWKDVANKS